MKGLIEIEVARTAASPFNPRRVRASDASVIELAASVAAVGLIQPVTVRCHPDVKNKKLDYEIVCGERRLVASRIAGLKKIPALIKDLDDQRAREIIVTENMQREDLTPIEEARGVASLVAGGWDHATVAAHLGKSPSWVARRARIVKLAAPIREAFEGGALAGWSARHLELVARLPDAVQARWWSGMGKWERECIAGRGVAEIGRSLAHLQRDLAAAPWDLGASLGTAIAKDSRCSNCAMRSSIQPDLFDDVPKKGDRCLDATCWEEKLAAWTKTRVAELRVKHEGLKVIDDVRRGTNAEPPVKVDGRAWDYAPAKKGDRGAAPVAVIEDGGVRLTYMKKRAGTSGRSGEAARPKADPAAVRERRRIRHMCEAVEKLFKAAKYEDLTIERPRAVIALALQFGDRGENSCKVFDRDQKKLTIEEIARASWGMCVGNIRHLVWYNAMDVPTVEEIKWVAALIGADYGAVRAAAEAAHPEPGGKAAQKGVRDPEKASGKAEEKTAGAKKSAGKAAGKGKKK